MIIQGAKNHCIPIGVYVAILINHIKESVKFWARWGAKHYMKKHMRSDSHGGEGVKVNQSKSYFFRHGFFLHHPLGSADKLYKCLVIQIDT